MRKHVCFKKEEPYIRLLQGTVAKVRGTEVQILLPPGLQHSREAMQDSSTAAQQGSDAGQQRREAMQGSRAAILGSNAVQQHSRVAVQQHSNAGQPGAAAVPPPPCTAPASCNGCNPPLQSACTCLSSFLSAPAQPRPAQPFHAFTACVPPVCTLPHMKWKVQFFQGL